MPGGGPGGIRMPMRGIGPRACGGRAPGGGPGGMRSPKPDPPGGGLMGGGRYIMLGGPIL